MVIFDTERGIFLTGLVFIAILLIVIPIVKRKMTVKQLPFMILLAAAMIFWFVKSIGSHVVFGSQPMICIDNFIPFKTVFVPQTFVDQFPSRQEYVTYYLSPQCIRLAADFAFGILWGILVPIVFKTKDIKKYMFLTAVIVFPAEILINVFFLLGISYEGVYDTGEYILLVVGTILGWLIGSRISKNSKNKGDSNDNCKKSNEKL